MIEIHHLSYHYAHQITALEGIDLVVDKGEKIALVGPNGAGKTTLLLHLNGTLRGAGQVRINKLDLNEKNLPAIRAAVGMVFQSPDDQLFSASVSDDVAYGPMYQGLAREEVERRVSQALVQVGMDGFESRAPYHLSLGEKRRVALATVLSMRPDILAMDEPTAGLDPRGRRESIEMLRTLPQTIIAATHDMELVKTLFSRMIILNKGRIVYDGATKDAIRNEVLLERNGLI